MPCDVLAIDAQSPSAAVLQKAAGVLRRGGLVAFPTETVYGLAANALDARAVARMFAAKGRPASNPVIVHVASIDGARKLASSWPALAEELAQRFWPGPLTLVLPGRSIVPAEVTAGGPTVALRVPAHPVALGLLEACDLPLAAPSANRSTELSPTRAEHVLHSLADRIDLLLDAGPTPGGLESTVLDVTTTPPRLLRPGLVTVMELEAQAGPIDRLRPDAGEIARAPGQMPRHYAPRTPLEVAPSSMARVRELQGQGKRVGWLTYREDETIDRPEVLRILLPADAVSYSAQLYAALHRLDELGLDRIVVEASPEEDAWLAVRDRLQRAACLPTSLSRG